MDPNNPEHKEEIVVTPEEAKAEQEALKGATDEELREKLADKFGLDPDTDADLLDKLVEDKKADHQRLSGAIKQKIGYREKLKGSQPKQPEDSGKGQSQTKQQENIDELVSKKVAEQLEARDLKELNLAEELQSEIKDLAKLKGITVKEAAQLPYIKSRIEEVKEAQRVLDATPQRKGRGSYQTSYDPSKPLRYEDYDLNTKEGREAWNNAKAAKQKYQQEQGK